MSADFKPCPFCSKRPKMNGPLIYCNTNGCTLCNLDFSVAAWNRRATPPAASPAAELNLAHISQRTKAESDYWVNQLRMEVVRLRAALAHSTLIPKEGSR